MVRHGHPTMVQIDILLKCYYLRNYTTVARVEGISVNQVKNMKDNALRSIRLAYSESRMQGLRFDGEIVLRHMAKRCGIATSKLSCIFDEFIAQALASDSQKYWQRIKKRGNVPTAAELLDFIYDKFELDIEGRI